MAIDMDKNGFEDTVISRLALEKLAPVAENFRIYAAGWVGNNPKEWRVMDVTGAEFRRAKSGPNKGLLSVMIPGTKRTAYITKEEMAAAALAEKSEEVAGEGI